MFIKPINFPFYQRITGNLHRCEFAPDAKKLYSQLKMYKKSFWREERDWRFTQIHTRRWKKYMFFPFAFAQKVNQLISEWEEYEFPFQTSFYILPRFRLVDERIFFQNRTLKIRKDEILPKPPIISKPPSKKKLNIPLGEMLTIEKMYVILNS